MSETKWTPGPWKISGTATIKQSQKGWIASVSTVDSSANAHLIAAAPDLYEVLSDAVENNMQVENADWWGKVYKALSKARGETPV